MPAIQVRPVNFTDISALVSIDHHYTTEHVWQMDFQEDADQVKITFNERRLPRAMRVEYPRPSQYLAEIWNKKPGILVAELQNGEPAGYINLTDGVIPRTTEITDLAVTMRVRRQGIGALVPYPSVPGNFRAPVITRADVASDFGKFGRNDFHAQPQRFIRLEIAVEELLII